MPYFCKQEVKPHVGQWTDYTDTENSIHSAEAPS